MEKNVCVISFRGGEYRAISKVLLPPSYYENAMACVLTVNPQAKFVVVTDDYRFARMYFQQIPIVSSRKIPFMRYLVLHPRSKNIGKDFTYIQRAQYLILSNSSFSWWGAWSNQRNPFVVAPKYWANHNANDGFWSLGDSMTEGWRWLDKNGAF